MKGMSVNYLAPVRGNVRMYDNMTHRFESRLLHLLFATRLLIPQSGPGDLENDGEPVDRARINLLLLDWE